MITFLRLRPAARLTDGFVEARRLEGTTVLEIPDLGPEDAAKVLAGRLMPVSVGPSSAAPAWVLRPDEIEDPDAVAGWRLTLAHEGSREAVLDALARTEAAFLRTGRSRVAEAVRLAGLPGIATRVSVFVDSVPEAVAAVDEGAGDLLLRDWDVERLGALRDALHPRLVVERTAFPPEVGFDEVRAAFDPDVFQAHLGLVDGRGAARPRTEWAPGKDLPAPMPSGRLSAEWADAAWVDGEALDGLSHLPSDLARILERSLEGSPPSRDEVVRLFTARGHEVEAIARTADLLRAAAVGDRVTYVVNRNINYTNQCYFRCGFCAFSKGPRSLNLRGAPYLLEIHEVVARTVEAWERGATEVCLQGGIHPEFTGDFYLGVLRGIKEAVPEMHCHGFTPLEVWQGAETLGIEVREFLIRLRDAGLGSLPGTAAEILDDRVRRHLCPDKIRSSQWAEVMLTAHELGLRATSTIMFGHIDDPESWANHLEVIREIQRRSGGFTELVPLPFVHMGAPIYLRGRARPGPTWDEVVLVHAVGRLALDGLIPNIQASWVKLGLDAGARLLEAGCNDLGGTLMDENISRAAGASHGQLATPTDFERVIRQLGRTPARRNTLYEMLETAG